MCVLGTPGSDKSSKDKSRAGSKAAGDQKPARPLKAEAEEGRVEPETGAELPGPSGSSEAPASSVPGSVSECLGVTGSQPQPLKPTESEGEPETPSLALTKGAGPAWLEEGSVYPEEVAVGPEEGPVGLEEEPVYPEEGPVAMGEEPVALEEGPESGKSNSTCR